MQIKAILPPNAADPADQFPNIRQAKRQLNKRYSNIYSALYQYIKSFKYERVQNAKHTWRQPTKNEQTENVLMKVNQYEPVFMPNEYNYLLDLQKQQDISAFIERLMYGELLQDEEWTPRWWLTQNLTMAYSDATQEVTDTLNDIGASGEVEEPLSTQLRMLVPENILMSAPAQRRLGLIYGRVFEEMKGLTDESKSDLAATMTRAMSDGVGIPEIARRIRKRVEVSRSRAFRIARTEIMNAYRTATYDETQEINDTLFDDTDYEFKLLWFSALAPTTRTWHASRHGNTYTKPEVTKFYSERGNAINCLCSQRPLLVYKKDGKPVAQQKLIERLDKQKKAWQATH